MSGWDFAQIAQWLEINTAIKKKIKRFQSDSRAIQPGDLFCALKGEKVDGHTFLSEVAARGASSAIVSKEYKGEDFGLSLLPVDHVLESLQRLARKAHQMRKTRVVAVTGSVGKTTTKEFIATLLLGKFNVAKTIGNANSQVTFPLAILNAQGEEEVFVMEMGMSKPCEIERLVQIAPPEIALITKIALSHAENFPRGLVQIAEAKAEIFSSFQTRLGIFNEQVGQFPAAFTGHCQKMSYGLEKENDWVLKKEKGQFYIQEKDKASFIFSLPFQESHLCENFLGAAAVARAMGMEWELIAEQALQLKVYPRRFEKIEREGIFFLNDSYNANPTSMRAALTQLPLPQVGGKRIAVLGAMKELGVFSEESHKEIGEIALHHVDHLLCLGEECLAMVEIFEKANRSAEYFEDLELLKKRVFELAKAGDVVLLKGSNSKCLWKVLES